MGKFMDSVNEKKYDVRTMQKSIVENLISREDIADHDQKLEDDSDNAEEVVIEDDEDSEDGPVKRDPSDDQL